MKTKKTKLVKPKSFKPLKVLTWDDPGLRIVAKDVKNPKTKKFRRFIQRLLVTFPIFGGVGIAAPQVGESLRVIIIASKPTLAYPNAPTMEPIVMINPVLCFRSKKMEKGWEGCGSLPGIRAIVLRYAWIEARYTDMSGKKTLRWS